MLFLRDFLSVDQADESANQAREGNTIRPGWSSLWAWAKAWVSRSLSGVDGPVAVEDVGGELSEGAIGSAADVDGDQDVDPADSGNGALDQVLGRAVGGQITGAFE